MGLILGAGRILASTSAFSTYQVTPIQCHGSSNLRRSSSRAPSISKSDPVRMLHFCLTHSDWKQRSPQLQLKLIAALPIPSTNLKKWKDGGRQAFLGPNACNHVNYGIVVPLLPVYCDPRTLISLSEIHLVHWVLRS